MAVGVVVLKKVKVPLSPAARAVPVLFTHSMELPDKLSAQPKLLAAVVGSEGRLLPLVVQPY